MSIARWDLKEAAGKTLARRTGIRYEAATPDEKANIFKVQYLYGRRGRILGGHKREGECALPGEIWLSAERLGPSKGGATGSQKSAEGIIRPNDPVQGPNMNDGAGARISMTLEDTDKNPEKGGPIPAGSGRNLQGAGEGVSSVTARREPCCPPEEGAVSLMEAVVGSENMRAAYARVVSNRGAAGVDGMSVADLKAHLVQQWPSIKEGLLRGKYQPQPVLGVQIPKPGGGVRQLGIPTVVDRLIQQALHQVLSPIFEPGFSESSYGFRPGRSAHQAVRRARELVREGRRWVVDLDLEKFFDRVNHDVLMARVARLVKDKRVLGLIRRYLQAGMMQDGLAQQRKEGTPQGGPLSP